MSGTTVYAVASGKGGVGKTTTTVNLGTALAGAGHRVAIVDADLGMANAAGFLGLSPDGATLHDVLADEATVPEATYEVADGIAAIPGSPDLEAFAAVDAAGLDDVVDRLRGEFEYVLLDVGAGVNHEAVLPLGVADEVLVVSTPEPASAQDVRKTVDLAETAGGSIAGLVVTRARADGDVSHEDLADRLDVPLLGSIPEDETVRDSVLAGTPLVAHDPEAPAASAYRELATRLVDGEDASGAASAGETDDDAATAAGRDADSSEPAAAESVVDEASDPATAAAVEDALAQAEDAIAAVQDGDAIAEAEDDADDEAADDDAGDEAADDDAGDESENDDAIAEAEDDGSATADAAAAEGADAPGEEDESDERASEAGEETESGEAASGADEDDHEVTIPDADEQSASSPDAEDGEDEDGPDGADLDEDAIPFQGDDATPPVESGEEGIALGDSEDSENADDEGEDDEETAEEEGGFLSGIF